MLRLTRGALALVLFVCMTVSFARQDWLLGIAGALLLLMELTELRKVE